MNNPYKALHFDLLINDLITYAASGLGADALATVEPKTSLQAVQMQLEETEEACLILKQKEHGVLHGLVDLRPQLKKLSMATILSVDDLLKLSAFLRSIRLIRKDLEIFQHDAPRLFAYSRYLPLHQTVEQEVDRTTEGNRVSDKASSYLATLRKKIAIIEARMISKVEKCISSPTWSALLQEPMYQKKHDRYVLPVLAQYKRQVDGSIVATSSTGATVFVEPNALRQLREELDLLRHEEEAEVYQVLSALTALFLEIEGDLLLARDTMISIDSIFARAKYSRKIGGNAIALNTVDRIDLKGARHPMLGEACRPLNIRLGEDFRTLLITGPNTGGKTVALKTLGACALLAQCGILPPVQPGSTLPIFNHLLVDIGDSQDLSTSLSTFSGHMTQLIDMIGQAGPGDLVLIDEIGTGTDPAEGAALGVAILEAFYAKGALTMATTHYGELKEFGEIHDGFENGAMAFDEASLQPLYRLDIGASGASKGFWISERLGLHRRILDRAKQWRAGNRVPSAPLDFQKRKERTLQIKEAVESPFRRGDRVRHQGTETIGLFYDGPDDHGMTQVLVDNQLQSIHHRRLELILPATELYPPGYNLDQLFNSFASRKLEKDLQKGRFKDLEEVNERLHRLKQE